MDSRLVVARREVGSLSREKTIVLALLIQLFVAAFSSFLVVGLASLYDPGTIEDGTVRFGVTGNASDALVAAADEEIGLVDYPSTEAALTAFERDRVQGVILATYEGPDDRISVVATVPSGSLRTTFVVTQLRSALEALEHDERQRRADFLERTVLPKPPAVGASPYFGFTYTVLLPLLIFLPVFISGSIAVDSLTEEVERGTLELLLAAPLSFGDVVEGKALVAILLVPAQAVFWLGLLGLNGIGIRSPGVLLGFVTALGAGFVAIGLAIAVLVPVRQRAQLLYSTTILVLLTAGAFLPEHPATTVALLAIGSPTLVTYATVAGGVIAAIGLVVGVRIAVTRVDPAGL